MRVFLGCAPQQRDASRTVCFLGRFLPKLGGAFGRRLFLSALDTPALLLNIGEAMPAKPPVIVHSDYRPKRARKRKQSAAIPLRIVAAKPPKKHLGGPVQRIGGVQEPERPRVVSQFEGI